MLSQQGDKIVFCAHGPKSPKALWVRALDSFALQRLDNTDGAFNPFWSPDGKFIGFFANGKLNRIPTAGGSVTAVTDVTNARGGDWGPDGSMLFTPDIQSPIFQVGANGGKAAAVTKLDVSKHSTHRWPVFLPDGKHFLYLATNHSGGKTEENGIYYASLDGKENRMVVSSDSAAQYASGYLLFHSGTMLMAQPFDPSSGKVSGEALPVVDKVRQDSGVWRTMFTASQTGLLVYEPGSADAGGSRLIWFDRSGKQVGQVGELGAYMDPHISPDGKRIAFAFGDPQREVWIYDMERGTKTRLTFQAATARIQPAWSPDGKTIVYTSNVPSTTASKTFLYLKPASGNGADKLQMGGETDLSGYLYGSWSPDGQYFTYITGKGPTGWTLNAKPETGDSEAFVVVAPASTQSNILYYRISPDGHWVAYSSDESGQRETYIAPFPRGEGKWQVSTGGGFFPAWRGDSKELYYYNIADQMMACPIKEKGKVLEIGTPQPLFRANPTALGVFFDVSADGKRFLVNVTSDEAPTPLHLVADWTAELKKK